MSKIFYIENTDGTISFKLAPGTYDGPQGIVKPDPLTGINQSPPKTDLRLYGLGFMEWGEGVDENFLRVAENFACEEKVIGDPDYDPDNIAPKDERDLGFGQGINYPVNGQTWFNVTRKQVFVYDNPGNVKDTTPTSPTFGKPLGKWIRVGASSVQVDTVSPTDPDEGDLWYDVSYTDPSCTPTGQLKIWTGITTGWVSVAERYVSKAGDIMCGFLTLHDEPIDNMHAATKGYVDTVAAGVGAGTFVLKAGDVMTGFLTLHSHPVQPMHAATKDYVDTEISTASAEFVKKSGDTMDTGRTLVLGRDPIDDMDAVTKRYIDSIGSGNSLAVDPVKIGTIVHYAGAAAPENWLLCDGRAVSRTEYSELFGIIATMYGIGDGTSTFNLPDLRGRIAVGKDNMGGVSANVITDSLADTLGGKFGNESVILTSAQMPSHTHTGTTSTAGNHQHNIPAYGMPNAGNGFHNAVVGSSTGTFTTPETGNHSHTLTLDATGGGSAHPNVQPSFTTNYIIKAKPELVTIGGGGTTGDYVRRNGDSMYGDLTMINDSDINLARDPIDPMHAVTKQYVDDLIANLNINTTNVETLFSWGSFSTR
jgi:microcystin-dependent protein